MRILQVNTLDVGGGAEAIARALHEGYAQAGHEAWLAVGEKRGSAPNVVEIPNDVHRSRWERTFLRLARSRDSRTARLLLGAVSSPRRALRTLRGRENFEHPGTRELLTFVPRPDVLHLHNLHGDYFDLRLLPELTRAVPAVVTLHDAWLTTGHCAHSFDCERWTAGCGSCPYLDTYPAVERDATAFNWRRKRAIFGKSRLWVVTQSEWLLERARRSILQPAIAGSSIIPYGIDLTRFRPHDRAEARDALGLPRDAIVLLAAAYQLETNPFKDFATLRAALARIGDAFPMRRVIFLAAGGSLEGNIGRAEVRSRRFEPAMMAHAYAAADVFLHAARADTFPVVTLEALACGTPVVATAVGGIPDQLRGSDAGVLTPQGDAQALAGAVARIISDDALQGSMRRAARAHAEARFDVNRMVADYLQLLARLVA